MSPGPWPDTSKLHYQWAVFSVGNTGHCSEEASVLGHAFFSFLYRAECGRELPTLCLLAGYLASSNCPVGLFFSLTMS